MHANHAHSLPFLLDSRPYFVFKRTKSCARTANVFSIRVVSGCSFHLEWGGGIGRGRRRLIHRKWKCWSIAGPNGCKAE